MPHRWLPPREKVLSNRWLRPVARHLDDDRLWHFDREPVARGVAIGLFFGLLLPLAQFLFAAVSAIVLRGNVPTAAVSTLITNPITFPPIYWLAYRLGTRLIEARSAGPVADVIASEAGQVAHHTGWLESVLYWVHTAGLPLATGLLVLACCASLTGYVLVRVLWRPHRH